MPTLAHALVTAPGASPNRWALFLHGILGTGSNWRTFARQWTARHPSWGAVLVDLRLHGGSTGFEPPHTLEACAADLRALEATLPGPARAALGHSFGGKVALAWLRSAEHVRTAWIIDSTPSARPDARGSETTVRIVSLLERLPPRFDTREAFIAAIEREGHDRGIAMWLAMQVKPAREGTGYEWRIDLPGIRAMLDDYFAVDLWDVLSTTHADVHLVIGGRSSVLGEADRAHARRLSEARSNVHVALVEHAGHWVHVDAPEALFALVDASTPP